MLTANGNKTEEPFQARKRHTIRGSEKCQQISNHLFPKLAMDKKMSEPITGAAAGAAGWKMIGGAAAAGAIGAGLASVVVMCAMTPRSPKEWAVGLISTVVASVGGGAAVIQHFGLQSWAHDPIGLVAMLGLVFACGLPGWAIVRWLFNYIERRQSADIRDVISDVKGAM